MGLPEIFVITEKGTWDAKALALVAASDGDCALQTFRAQTGCTDDVVCTGLGTVIADDELESAPFAQS